MIGVIAWSAVGRIVAKFAEEKTTDGHASLQVNLPKGSKDTFYFYMKWGCLPAKFISSVSTLLNESKRIIGFTILIMI